MKYEDVIKYQVNIDKNELSKCSNNPSVQIQTYEIIQCYKFE